MLGPLVGEPWVATCDRCGHKKTIGHEFPSHRAMERVMRRLGWRVQVANRAEGRAVERPARPNDEVEVVDGDLCPRCNAEEAS